MKYPQPFSCTAIGSVPYLDPAEAVDSMSVLEIPAYPQMVKISQWEDMFLGALNGLPGLIVNAETQTVRGKKKDRENELADFYNKFLAGEREFLALAPQSAQGFEAFLRRAAEDPQYGSDFLKVQIIGPLTFGQMVVMEDEASSLVDDQELLEATALALGGKAAWQAAKLRALGRTPVVFIDEPGLSSYGSAFCTLTADKVIETMGSASAVVREDGPALIGCHICGNTDWGLIIDTGMDIVNFDALEVMEQFSLYPKQITAFLEKGGRILWGLVPAQGFNLEITADYLVDSLLKGFQILEDKGLDRQLLSSQSLISAACGLGGLSPELARAATAMMRQVSDRLRELKV